MKRQLWIAALIALVQIPMMFYDIGTPFVWGPPSIASAQNNPSTGCLNAGCVNDPCALGNKISVALPYATAGASPTALLVSGAAGLVTRICSYQFTLSGSSPTIIIGTGQASNSGASPTPCATGTTSFTSSGWKTTLSSFGGNGAGSLAGGGDAFIQSPGDGNHTVLGPFPPVPTATASAGPGQTWDLCVTTCPAGAACATSNTGGTLTYVQTPY